MKPLIKICGINDFNVLQQLVSIDNINYLGFIFYEKSVRNVSPEFLEQVKEFESVSYTHLTLPTTTIV